jgi:bifunctional polynucleotide phosphatase/kinase
MDDQILAVAAGAPGKKFHKVGIFDYDWTLVKPKDGRRFPKSVEDWQYLRPSVPSIMRKFAKDHRIVIVTDQSKQWKVDQILSVIADLGIHATVIVGVKEESRKPSTSLFYSVFPKLNKEKAFYVGDAAGRPDDWADKDRVFAESLGVKFYTPEDIFPLDTVNPQPKLVGPSKTQEVVIMVGYPASGKSTIAKSLTDYHYVEGDALKTTKAMIKDAEKHSTQSIVFDSTAGTKEKRSEFIEFAKKHSLPVRIFWVKTPIDIAMERNNERAKSGGTKIPDVVFYVYRKKFQEPTEEEGAIVVPIEYITV